MVAIPHNRLAESIGSQTGIGGFQTPVHHERCRDLARMMEDNRKRFRRREPPSKGMRAFKEAVAKNQIDILDYGLRPLFEALVPHGRELVEHMEDQLGWLQICEQVRFAEADGTSVKDFADISYALLSSKAMAAYNSPQFIGASMVTTAPSKLKTERMARLAKLGDVAEEVGEFDPFPVIKRGVDYVDIGEAKKRGFQLPISREAVFFNRTAQAVDDAAEVSEAMALRKELSIIDVMVGTVQNWKPKHDNKSTATFQTGAGGDAFDNTVTSNGFESWLSIDAVRQKARDMIDPNTGQPIVLGPMRTALIPDEISGTVDHFVSAREVRMTDVSNIETIGSNPLARYRPEIKTNEYVSARTGSPTTWFYGAPKKAFVYKEHWGYTLQRVPMNSHYMATHDVVADLVASEYGDPFVMNPRYWFKNTQ